MSDEGRDDYGQWVADLLGVDGPEDVPEALRGLENGAVYGGRRAGRAAASRAAAKAFRRGALASGRHVHMVGPEGPECIGGPAGCVEPLTDPSQGCTGGEEGIGGYELRASWTDEVAAWTVGEAEEAPEGVTGTPGAPQGGPPAQMVERRGKGVGEPREPLKRFRDFESEGKGMMEETPMGGSPRDEEGSTVLTAPEGVEEIRSPQVRRSRKHTLLIGLRELGPSLAIGALACLAAVALIVVNILGITGVWGGSGTTPDCATLERQTGIPASQCVEAPVDPSSGDGEGLP